MGKRRRREASREGGRRLLRGPRLGKAGRQAGVSTCVPPPITSTSKLVPLIVGSPPCTMCMREKGCVGPPPALMYVSSLRALGRRGGQSARSEHGRCVSDRGCPRPWDVGVRDTAIGCGWPAPLTLAPVVPELGADRLDPMLRAEGERTRSSRQRALVCGPVASAQLRCVASVRVSVGVE